MYSIKRFLNMNHIESIHLINSIRNHEDYLSLTCKSFLQRRSTVWTPTQATVSTAIAIRASDF